MSTIETKRRFDAPSALSLASGILILAGAITSWVWHAAFYPQMGWMMSPNMMPFIANMSAVGVVSGAIVLIGALMMYYKPSESYKWGVIVLVFSIISLFGMGGFLIGAVLGIVGGILAITRR